MTVRVRAPGLGTASGPAKGPLGGDVPMREPLSDATLAEVVEFVHRSNPFAQKTWGWDSGRFMDWRWGTNTRRGVESPRVVRRQRPALAGRGADPGAVDRRGGRRRHVHPHARRRSRSGSSRPRPAPRPADTRRGGAALRDLRGRPMAARPPRRRPARGEGDRPRVGVRPAPNALRRSPPGRLQRRVADRREGQGSRRSSRVPSMRRSAANVTWCRRCAASSATRCSDLSRASSCAVRRQRSPRVGEKVYLEPGECVVACYPGDVAVAGHLIQYMEFIDVEWDRSWLTRLCVDRRCLWTVIVRHQRTKRVRQRCRLPSRETPVRVQDSPVGLTNSELDECCRRVQNETVDRRGRKDDRCIEPAVC